MNDNLAIGIMTSINLKNRYIACKNTWVKDFDNVFFFGGDTYCEDLIRLPEVGEDYDSAFLKQQLGLKQMFEKNNEFDWFSISGCDTILFKEPIVEVLNTYNRNEDIILGQTFSKTVINDIEVTLIAGGASFFISNSLMKKLYPLIDEFNDNWKQIVIDNKSNINYAYCDVAIIYMIKFYFNIDPTHVPGMFSQPPEFYNINNNYGNLQITSPNNFRTDIIKLKNPLSYHYIKFNDMERVYNNFK